jgi:isopentenyl diphosphate isomerase/L-lactate dehydrogenase-like FMN-dependent dehydrogenase
VPKSSPEVSRAGVDPRRKHIRPMATGPIFFRDLRLEIGILPSAMADPRPEPEGDRSEILLDLDRLRARARQTLPSAIFDYVDGGAGRERTLRANRRDFDSLELLPLVMRDVSNPDPGARLLGKRLPLPLGFSPTALHRLVHPEGEVASARAAQAARLPLTVSAMSSVAIEDVAGQSAHDNLWFQTYLFKDPAVAPELVARAEAAGCTALVVTVGCPVMGYRDRNLRNRFELPPSVAPAHFRRNDKVDHNNPLGSLDGAEIDPAATWKDIETLRGKTRLPVLVKGVMNPADVAPALDTGIAGLIVSNHGGRQLDTTISTISALPGIASALDGRGALLVDSGFRRGTDLLKALALGADAVLLGRPLLWALAVGGTAGVAAAIDRLGTELRIAMQLAGCPTIASLRDNAGAILRALPTSPSV